MAALTPNDVPGIDDWNQLLAGRTAVVTGGGSGIGRATAELFVAHGAEVHAAELDPDLVVEVGAIDGVIAHHVDVRDPDRVAEFATAVPTPDVIVNNVGDYRPSVRFPESGPNSWQAMYEVNLLHLFAVTHAFLPRMIEGGRGSIVNLHSVEGMRGYPGRAGLRRDESRRSALHDLARRRRRPARHPGQRRRSRPHPNPPSRLSPTARGRRPRCLARLGARRPGRVAGGDRPHNPVPCVGPKLVHHRPQHSGRRRQPRPIGLDLEPTRRTVREPANHAVANSGDDPHRTHVEPSVIADGTKLNIDSEAKVANQPQHRRLRRSRRAIAGLQRPRQP